MIGYSVLPAGSAIAPWFVGLLLLFGCFALLTPLQEYLFTDRNRRLALAEGRLNWHLLPTREASLARPDFSGLQYDRTVLGSTYARVMTELDEPPAPGRRHSRDRYEAKSRPELGYVPSPPEEPRRRSETRDVPRKDREIAGRVSPPDVDPFVPTRQESARKSQIAHHFAPQRVRPRTGALATGWLIGETRTKRERPIQQPSKSRKATSVVVAPVPAPARPTKKKSKKQLRRERKAAEQAERQRLEEQQRHLAIQQQPQHQTSGLLLQPSVSGLRQADQQEPVQLEPESEGEVEVGLRRYKDKAGADCLEGVVDAVFQPGQKRTYAHVAFDPLFERNPEVVCELLDGEGQVRLKTPQVFAYGTRLELSRKHEIDSRQVVHIGLLARTEK